MVKIVTEGCPEGDKIVLDEITCKYIQEADCVEGRDNDWQELILSTRDGGGGKFINISTKSWSITGDNFADDIIPVLEDFKARIKGWCTK